MTEVPEELKRAVATVLAAVLAGDAEAGADAIAEIVNGGPDHVHAALCGWAAPVLQATDDRGGPGFWMIEATDTRTGERVDLGGTTVPPADRDALRIATCFGNRDHDTIAAIVKTYWDEGPESLASLLASSVNLSASVVKVWMDEDGAR